MLAGNWVSWLSSSLEFNELRVLYVNWDLEGLPTFVFFSFLNLFFSVLSFNIYSIADWALLFLFLFFFFL
jgi:hypothetical protein